MKQSEHSKHQDTSSQPNCIGFPPSICNDCRVLILGSMPGVASLKAQQYYAYAQNRFWPMMSLLLENTETVPEIYEERLHMLHRHHIGLWDAIGTCDRDGSLDSAIQNETGNDFSVLLEKHPSVKLICCNGAKAFQCFKKWNKALLTREGLTVLSMPSTSPANARWRMEMLVNTWRNALEQVPGVIR